MIHRACSTITSGFPDKSVRAVLLSVFFPFINPSRIMA